MNSVITRDHVAMVRHALVAVAIVAALLVGMPGLWDAVSVSSVAVSLAGGIAVGISALAARTGAPRSSQ